MAMASAGFGTASLSTDTKVYYVAIYSFLTVQPAFAIADVCALHEQSAPAASNSKISKLQIILVKQCSKQVYFSRGCKSLMHGVVPEALASRKLVVGDDSSEGSETAKSGTDEQKRYMRHNCLG